MKSLPFAARLYVAAVIAAGAVLLVLLTPRARFDQPLLFAILLILSVISSAFKVSLPLAKSGSTMSVSYAVDFAALILLGPHETMLVAVASAWSQCTFGMKHRNPPHRALFSMACLAITVQAAGLCVYRAGRCRRRDGAHARPDGGPARRRGHRVLRPQHTAHRGGDRTVDDSRRVFKVWNENFFWSAPSYFVGAGVAFVAKWAVLSFGIWIALLLCAPLYLTYRTYKVYVGRIDDERRHVQEMADLHLATIEALALAIDAKEQTAQSHIRRVQVYAAGLAQSLGMPDSEIQGVKTAALLHDIGKLAVPEHILAKPGPLTQEEFQKIRLHPQVGAEIISAVPFPYPVAPLILSHHERWDGKGYPQGLKGDEIPLGARILSVVDYFDALTSERPYHRAMAHDAALALLPAGSAARRSTRRSCSDSSRCCRASAKRPTGWRTRRRDGSRSSRPPDLGRPAAGFQPEGKVTRSSKTSPTRTARFMRSTKSRRPWAPAWVWPTRWRSSPRN